MRVFDGFLSGINLGGWLSQCGQPEKARTETFITPEDFARIADMGFDHVRLPVDYFFLESDAGETNPLGWDALEKSAALCARYGLNLLIDLHKAYGYTFDPMDKAADRAAFFYDDALQARFCALWQRLARRFGGEKHIAFDLLNEVVLPEVASAWNSAAQKAIAAIREAAPDTWIVVGGARYNHAASVPEIDLEADERLVYNFHCYDPLVFTHQGAYWVKNMAPDFRLDYPGDPQAYAAGARALDKNHAAGALPQRMSSDYFEQLFAPAVAHAEKHAVPLYCGEYGVIDRADPEASLRWLEDITRIFLRHGIGRALWTYKKMDFGLTDPHYAPVRDRICALITGRN